MYTVNLSAWEVIEAGREYCKINIDFHPRDELKNRAWEDVWEDFDFVGWTDKANREGLPDLDDDDRYISDSYPYDVRWQNALARDMDVAYRAARKYWERFDWD